MGKKVFILGGARSGKSRFALNLCDSYIRSKDEVSGRDKISLLHKKAYIATAEPGDEEMKERIERHRKERGMDWFTIEEPLRLTDTIKNAGDKYDVMLIDCLTLWLSNLLINNMDVENEIEYFVSSLKNIQSSIFIVSNEVGAGIVPIDALSRRFRDMAGYLNQKVAEVSDEVYFVIAGIPIRIK